MMPIHIQDIPVYDKCQTGEVQGHAPVSPLKVMGLVVLGIVVILLILWLYNSNKNRSVSFSLLLNYVLVFIDIG